MNVTSLLITYSPPSFILNLKIHRSKPKDELLTVKIHKFITCLRFRKKILKQTSLLKPPEINMCYIYTYNKQGSFRRNLAKLKKETQRKLLKTNTKNTFAIHVVATLCESTTFKKCTAHNSTCFTFT